MYKLILADGTELTGFTKNGDNYIRKEKVDESVFKDNLSTLEITDSEETITMHNAELIQQVYDAILALCPGQNFYKNPTKNQIKRHLKAGHMILLEERNPTHTAVYLWDGDKIVRFSNGGHKTVTLNQIMSKRSADGYYKGCAAIRK